jgi:hypothetical protein
MVVGHRGITNLGKPHFTLRLHPVPKLQTAPSLTKPSYSVSPIFVHVLASSYQFAYIGSPNHLISRGLTCLPRLPIYVVRLSPLLSQHLVRREVFLLISCHNVGSWAAVWLSY